MKKHITNYFKYCLPIKIVLLLSIRRPCSLVCSLTPNMVTLYHSQHGGGSYDVMSYLGGLSYYFNIDSGH